MANVMFLLCKKEFFNSLKVIFILKYNKESNYESPKFKFVPRVTFQKVNQKNLSCRD